MKSLALGCVLLLVFVPIARACGFYFVGYEDSGCSIVVRQFTAYAGKACAVKPTQASYGFDPWEGCIPITPKEGWRYTAKGNWPTGGSEGDACEARWKWGCTQVYAGKWDPDDGGCVKCVGKTEGKIEDSCAIAIEDGDGNCEAACGADDLCDERGEDFSWLDAAKDECGTCDGCLHEVVDCDAYDDTTLGDDVLRECEVTDESCAGYCDGQGCCFCQSRTCSSVYECEWYHDLIDFWDETPDAQCYYDGSDWVWGSPPASEDGLCNDGYDNDCDGSTDVADPDCCVERNLDGDSYEECCLDYGGRWVEAGGQRNCCGDDSPEFFNYVGAKYWVDNDWDCATKPDADCCFQDPVTKKWHRRLCVDVSGAKRKKCGCYGSCCDDAWHEDGECCAYQDCKDLGITCDEVYSPGDPGYYPHRYAKCHTGGDWRCDVCNPCEVNADCESSHCCEGEIDSDANDDGDSEDCVPVGSRDITKKYLCVSASEVRWIKCKEGSIGSRIKIGNLVYECGEEGRKWVKRMGKRTDLLFEFLWLFRSLYEMLLGLIL
jgi:hypothetical protein